MEVIRRFPEYRKARLGLEDPGCTYGRRVGQESLQEALRFVCGTEAGGGVGTRISTCL